MTGVRDAAGNAVGPDDPRLPSQEDTERYQAEADRGLALLRRGGIEVPPEAIDVPATLNALVSLLVPPDETHPMTRMFRYRLQENRLKEVRALMDQIREEVTAPTLVLATPDGDIPVKA